MKKVKFLLPALALVVAIAFSAFTSPAKSVVSKQNPNLYWQNPSGGYEGQNTLTAERTQTTCVFTQVLCERGYLESHIDLIIENGVVTGFTVKNDPNTGLPYQPDAQIFKAS